MMMHPTDNAPDDLTLNLPDEILQFIFQWLLHERYGILRGVCKRWRTLIKCNTNHWKMMCESQSLFEYCRMSNFEDAFYEAATIGNRAMFGYLVDKVDDKELAIKTLVRNGHLSILRTVDDQIIQQNLAILFLLAVTCGQLSICMWLWKYVMIARFDNNERFRFCIYDTVIETPHLHIILWLRQIGVVPPLKFLLTYFQFYCLDPYTIKSILVGHSILGDLIQHEATHNKKNPDTLDTLCDLFTRRFIEIEFAKFLFFSQQ